MIFCYKTASYLQMLKRKKLAIVIMLIIVVIHSIFPVCMLKCSQDECEELSSLCFIMIYKLIMLDDEKSFEASLQNHCVWIRLSNTCLKCKEQETGSITYKENIETI